MEMLGNGPGWDVYDHRMGGEYGPEALALASNYAKPPAGVHRSGLDGAGGVKVAAIWRFCKRPPECLWTGLDSDLTVRVPTRTAA